MVLSRDAVAILDAIDTRLLGIRIPVSLGPHLPTESYHGATDGMPLNFAYTPTLIDRQVAPHLLAHFARGIDLVRDMNAAATSLEFGLDFAAGVRGVSGETGLSHVLVDALFGVVRPFLRAQAHVAALGDRRYQVVGLGGTGRTDWELDIDGLSRLLIELKPDIVLSKEAVEAMISLVGLGIVRWAPAVNDVRLSDVERGDTALWHIVRPVLKQIFIRLATAPNRIRYVVLTTHERTVLFHRNMTARPPVVQVSHPVTRDGISTPANPCNSTLTLLLGLAVLPVADYVYPERQGSPPLAGRLRSVRGASGGAPAGAWRAAQLPPVYRTGAASNAAAATAAATAPSGTNSTANTIPSTPPRAARNVENHSPQSLFESPDSRSSDGTTEATEHSCDLAVAENATTLSERVDKSLILLADPGTEASAFASIIFHGPIIHGVSVQENTFLHNDTNTAIATAPTHTHPPTRLTLGRERGKGAMWTTYEVPDSLVARLIVPDLCADPVGARAAIASEASVYRHAKAKGLAGVVMPLLHGLWGGVSEVDGRECWLTLLTDMGETVVTAQLSEQQRRAIVDAYARLHAAGVLHNDADPRNWCVSTRSTRSAPGTASIIDFGLSILYDANVFSPDEWDNVCQNELLQVCGWLQMSMPRGYRPSVSLDTVP